jgi:hypothetical protein
MSCYSIDGRYTNNENFGSNTHLGILETEFDSTQTPTPSLNAQNFPYTVPTQKQIKQKCNHHNSHNSNHHNIHNSNHHNIHNSNHHNINNCITQEREKADLCSYLANKSVKVPITLLPTIETICNKSKEDF